MAINEEFEEHRTYLFSLAYRMMGTVTDAEDVLQDAFLRVREAVDILNPKAYLTTVVTRLCLNRLDSAATQREVYLGPWLPEPVLTENRPTLVDPMERAVVFDSISIAFLVMLESLSPAERAVFLLHDVFDYSHAEVGAILNRNEASCRQLLRRAKQRLAQRRPRFESTQAADERLLRGFVEVIEAGEVEAFLQMLADDVALVPDGGGERGAAIRILQGRDKVAAFIQGVNRNAPASLTYRSVTLNNHPAMLAETVEGKPYFALFVYGDGAQISFMHVIAGRKLRSLENVSLTGK